MKGKRIRTVSESGVMILETMIASVILLVGIVGVMGLLTVAVIQNQGRGEALTRTTMYAQDKMDQLMSLGFNDGTTNTTVYPSTPTGGTGLGGTMAGSATVGGTNSASPTTSYVDYLDGNGKQLTSYTNDFYTRVWSISTNAGANLKTITVVSVGLLTKGQGPQPSSTLVCSKSQ
jgi:hypothetical protein